ncbi:LysM domain protein [Cordyceps fumosorosea ARSEF 2679]|uniref:LysM domain protein n=1 Tax=Cordyceps fumosorosea (strain ARSEF 2679) TaxID=1081104 RepID=A0A167TMI9_CORFA|nr:LysM domain protein [Cordyceps fumosorosea ARSEF 2679]OAA60752.1 LysM domain protein [Cordyceps fumosorosea ARSEF 2679]
MPTLKCLLERSWKLDHPGLSQDEVSDIHGTANRMKDQLANPSPPEPPVVVPSIANRPSSSWRAGLGKIASNSTGGANSSATLDRALQIVQQAQREFDSRNKARFADPRINNYYDRHSGHANKARALDRVSLYINETVTTAAAIVAAANEGNVTKVDYSKYVLPAEIASKIASFEEDSDLIKRSPPGTGASWWMETIRHDGKVPFGGSANDGYKVFRNVKDYGAVGDGKADDTDAINKAMSDGHRCGADCGSSTIKPAIVYFPAGSYRVRQTIPMFYNTQVIGNPNDMPIILADENFVGLGVLSSDEYTGGSGGADEWFINQNNFFRQVRNLIIDTSKARMANIAGLHWQVAQATSIFNVHFYGSKDRGKKHIGIFAENGSGGFMGDLVFSDTSIGIRCGNQQFTSHSMAFLNVGTAVDLLWDWGWTWKNMYVFNTDVGFSMDGSFMGGSMLLLDSHFEFVNLGIHIKTQKGGTEPEQFSMTLENVKMSGVKTMAIHEASNTRLAGGSSLIESWILGRMYDNHHPEGTFVTGKSYKLAKRQPELVMSNGVAADGYYIRSKPQYEHKSADDFISLAGTAKGDGVTDDSFAFALAAATARMTNKLLYIPMGSYIVTTTIFLPPGSVIVGECWAQIVARGLFFEDAADPKPVLSVGSYGDIGSMELQDLLLTVQGPTAGAVLMEWNIAQDKQGAAAMWDVHFRIGGAAGSHLQEADCPKLTGSVNKKCIAGSLMLHMTAESSGYLENVWAWVADHELDGGPSQTQIDIYVARGILIESIAAPVWLYGTSSEHSVLYQYMIYGARNIIQTESPYYLPDPQAPAPFQESLNLRSDPDFKECDSSNPHCAAAWGLSIIGSTNVRVYGAGLYNWFQKYAQPCVDTQDCQKRVLKVEKSGQVFLYNVYTIGTVEMINHGSKKPVLAKANTNTNIHPFTSVVNAWLRATTGEGELDDDDKNDEYEDYGTTTSCNGVYDTLKAIEASYDSIPDACVNQYLAKAFAKNLTTTRDKYNSIMGDDYESKFKIYHDIVQTQAISQIKKYMLDKGAEGWHCAKPEPIKCCNECDHIGGNYLDPICFHLGCFGADDGNPKKCSNGVGKKVSCPDQVGDYPKPLSWSLDDKDKFFDNMEKDYGVLRDWIEFTDYDVYYNYGCVWGWTEVDVEGMAQCRKDTDVFWHNYPSLKRDFKLPDPSDIIKRAYANTTRLMDETELQMTMAENYWVSWEELASTLVLPAMSMSAAVQNMEGIVKVANQKIEQDREEGIAAIISAVFFFVPFVGEAASLVGGAIMRTIINLAGTFADIGYSIYDTVKHPDNLLMNLFSIIFDAGSMKGAFKSMAAEWRVLKSDRIDTLPETFVRDVKSMRTMQGVCKL